VFVILRLDTSSLHERGPQTAVSMLKDLWSEAAAEREVVRLNQGGSASKVVYNIRYNP
jgi:hypothetical protein